MYNAHWIHSLPYSKFIELTLNTFQRQSVKEQDIKKSCAAIIAAHDFFLSHECDFSVCCYLSSGSARYQRVPPTSLPYKAAS